MTKNKIMIIPKPAVSLSNYNTSLYNLDVCMIDSNKKGFACLDSFHFFYVTCKEFQKFFVWYVPKFNAN